MDELVPIYKQAIFDDEVKEVIFDLAELGIDSVIGDGLLQQLPIFKVLIGLGKTSQNIHERNLLNQTITFVNTFNQNTIPQDKLDKYLTKLKNKEFAEAELGRVILCLNGYIDRIKSQILACIFKSYVTEQISWDEFCEMSEVVNRQFIQDLGLLRQLSEIGPAPINKADEYKYRRLEALGLVKHSTDLGTYEELQYSINGDMSAELSSLGRIYYNIINTVIP